MDLHATIEGIANVKLSDNLVVSRHVHDKRISWRPGSGSSSSSKPRFKRCSSLEKTVLGFASEHAQKLLAEAISSLMPDKSRSSYEAKFELWFGGYSESKGHTVRNNLGRISSFFPFSAFTFGCDCHEHTSPIKRRRTLQWWDCRSVTDRSLNQPRATLSSSATPSGALRELSKRVHLSALPAGSFPSMFAHLV